MSFESSVHAALGRALHLLDLPPGAEQVLRGLVAIDVDSGTAEQARDDDEHRRLGVLSWWRLVQLQGGPDAALAQLDLAVSQLADWGLVQVVGQQASDPVLPGTAAVRLTYHGRACLGLAPNSPDPMAPLAPALDLPGGWLVMHGHSREGLVVQAAERLGPVALRPHSLSGDEQDSPRLAGMLAAAICRDGGVCVDGFAAADERNAPLYESLFRRTASARGQRVLLLPSPAAVRVACAAWGAQLHYCDLPLHGTKERGRYDRRLTQRLSTENGNGTPDVCGVPDSDLARPEIVQTRWEDLLVPASVQHQLGQALMHARFRLNELPTSKNLPGRGQGYRLMLSGLPGTGKSMAAEALATTLGRPLVRLDLSSVLSKWLGETEKFLSQIFEIAEVSDAVLVLDEAEALFRQRGGGSEQGGGGGGGGSDGMMTVVAYLLARLDRFSGVLVATTNRTKDLDEAFFRRFDDYVILPIPDEPTRARMWAWMLGGAPPAGTSAATSNGAPAPAYNDLDQVDLRLLGRRFPVSGGLIRKAAIRAVAWSKGLDQPLTTPIVLASIARELEKNDRSPSAALVEPHRDAVKRLLEGPDALV